MYWQQANDTYNPMVATLMTKREFKYIMQYLYLVDIDCIDSSDRFGKVRPLVASINKQCLIHYKPTQGVSVDETMVKYFGKHGAKQHIHGKPIRFGYKFWTMASPTGYCIYTLPYGGKCSTVDEYGDVGIGLGGAVVSCLADQLPAVQQSHYHIVTDNFFTSPGLLSHLRSRGMAATGTVRINRTNGAPLRSVEEMKKMQRGSSDVVVDIDNGIGATRWKDNKVVTVLSTYTGQHPMRTASRFCRKERKRITIYQPDMINAYNKNMGGVDRMDENISAYRINIRSKKWWWPIATFLFDVAVNNAYRLYTFQARIPGQSIFDLLGFRSAIVEIYGKSLNRSIISRSLFPGSRIKSPVQSCIRNDGANQLIVEGTQRRCALSGCKGTSTFCCQKCNVGLHPKCFKDFHCK